MAKLTINYGALGANAGRALNELLRMFSRAGAPVVASDASKPASKRAGMAFKTVELTFADGQRASLLVKETGDVFEVKVNGSAVPLREQDDAGRAVAEIAAQLEKKRAAFQRALARTKVPIPPSVRVSAANRIKAKEQKRDALKEAVELAAQELSELKT